MSLQRRHAVSLAAHTIGQLLRRGEVDRAVVFGVLTRIWTLGAGPVTMLLIALRFTPVQQGYYYTFSSLLALQIFVQLGLETVTIQFASHEWSRLGLDKRRRIVGSPEALSRLVSLGRFAFQWHSIAGVLAALGLGLAGSVFFSISPSPGVEWLMPWLVLCGLTGIALVLQPFQSILEGCNQVSYIYGYRLVQGLLGSLCVWPAILLGAGLWTPVVSMIASIASMTVFVGLRYWRFFRPFLFPRMNGSRSQIKWRSEIWPMQWRIAGSWASGYFVFSLFTPVLFYFHGPVVAGQLGMTWLLVTAVFSVSSMWPQTKAPRFGVLIAKEEYDTLDRLFSRVALATWCVAAAGALTIWSGILFLNYFDQHLASRLLPPLPAGLFLLATVVSLVGVPMSVYLRAHKKEPLLMLSVMAALLTGVSTLVLGKYFAATGMASGYLAVNTITTPLVILTWYRLRRKWHSVAHQRSSGFG